MGNECLCWRWPRSSIHAPFFVPRHAAHGKPCSFEHSASKNPPPFKHLPPSTRGIPSFPHESHLGIVPTSPLPPYSSRWRLIDRLTRTVSTRVAEENNIAIATMTNTIINIIIIIICIRLVQIFPIGFGGHDGCLSPNASARVPRPGCLSRGAWASMSTYAYVYCIAEVAFRRLHLTSCLGSTRRYHFLK